jgi:hypothetical protein
MNRSLSTTISYKNAKQGEQQSAQAFTIELATIKEQIALYTNEQRTRHLLAKLKPALRTSIISYYKVPKRREDLISLATRLESASRGRDIYVVLGSSKRHASDSHADRVKRRRGSPSRGSLALRAPPSQQ